MTEISQISLAVHVGYVVEPQCIIGFDEFKLFHFFQISGNLVLLFLKYFNFVQYCFLLPAWNGAIYLSSV